MREIKKIIVHCSYTKPRMDIGVEEIRTWHVEENKWTDVGYHYVIRRDGTIETGRPLERPGAHVRGQNHDSIGICWVGGMAQDSSLAEDNRTADQSKALFDLIQDLQEKFPGAGVLGHRDIQGVSKACPCFDVRTWYADACMNTERKDLEKKRDQQESTARPSMTFRFSLWIILKLWRLYRFIRRR